MDAHSFDISFKRDFVIDKQALAARDVGDVFAEWFDYFQFRHGSPFPCAGSLFPIFNDDPKGLSVTDFFRLIQSFYYLIIPAHHFQYG